MENILNSKAVGDKRIYTNRDRLGDTLTVDGGDERWFVRINDEGEYTILYHSSPQGKTNFASEVELIQHLEGNRKVGKFKPNMGRY